MSNSEVVWNIVKNSSSFLYKNNGITLTNEPYNVLNVNSRKFSGLCNKKALDVSVVDGNVVMNKKRTKSARFPSKLKAAMILKKEKSACAVRKELAGSYYRVDLANYAVARYNKLNKSLKASKVVKKAPGAGDAMQISKTD
ncbi:hypothetical protein BVRB_036380 [Beta vulgaris subsp. vulgaris]|uniref:Ribosomal eL28/Mak16 domain-containing protein n=1 Tax=Beta vulgaris subsp. vulgaris TaxID=3555 RepID=A0A0J7YPD7_BETVV|nr:hypothetical protein BVRB_036380 [Beta vulgaris subsp. vulgaris]